MDLDTNDDQAATSPADPLNDTSKATTPETIENKVTDQVLSTTVGVVSPKGGLPVTTADQAETDPPKDDKMKPCETKPRAINPSVEATQTSELGQKATYAVSVQLAENIVVRGQRVCDALDHPTPRRTALPGVKPPPNMQPYNNVLSTEAPPGSPVPRHPMLAPQENDGVPAPCVPATARESQNKMESSNILKSMNRNLPNVAPLTTGAAIMTNDGARSAEEVPANDVIRAGPSKYVISKANRSPRVCLHTTARLPPKATVAAGQPQGAAAPVTPPMPASTGTVLHSKSTTTTESAGKLESTLPMPTKSDTPLHTAPVNSIFVPEREECHPLLGRKYDATWLDTLQAEDEAATVHAMDLPVGRSAFELETAAGEVMVGAEELQQRLCETGAELSMLRLKLALDALETKMRRGGTTEKEKGHKDVEMGEERTGEGCSELHAGMQLHADSTPHKGRK